jgi:hypothetical protein
MIEKIGCTLASIADVVIDVTSGGLRNFAICVVPVAVMLYGPPFFFNLAPALFCNKFGTT